MGALEGRVAIVTGGGRGIGRAEALHLAAEGAAVVVNDLGVDHTGRREPGARGQEAEKVAAEIVAAGGRAVANGDDVTSWLSGERLVTTALEAFGGLDILVNNAGFLRDRMLVNMTEADWDAVIAVHLKGHFVPLRHAAAYWRAEAKAGRPVAASVINTSSSSGLSGNPGQANYGTAKAGIAALTSIAAAELGRYGVRVNTISPAARTRLTESTPGLSDLLAPPEGGDRFDEWDPANVAPLVSWLAKADCPATGRVFAMQGGTIQLMTGWTYEDGIDKNGRWTVAELDETLPMALNRPTEEEE
jgi:NAD(P)-dependent dehydrogenase (short-subunit alcohol dehydrogenase family)